MSGKILEKNFEKIFEKISEKISEKFPKKFQEGCSREGGSGLTGSASWEKECPAELAGLPGWLD